MLHAIGFAPEACLGDDFMAPTWSDVSVALHISAYSLKALADAFAPLMTNGGSFVGLDFDNTVAWPAYNWMGVAKSALESISRYLAVALGAEGIRSNLVAAGPVKTMAAKSIPGLQEVRGRLGRSRPARLGRHRLVRRRQGVRRPAQRLVPGDDRRDHPRRRRLPRHRGLSAGGVMPRVSRTGRPRANR